MFTFTPCRCPYLGCQNKRMALGDLVPDRELKRKIMQMQSQMDQDSLMNDESDWEILSHLCTFLTISNKLNF